MAKKKSRLVFSTITMKKRRGRGGDDVHSYVMFINKRRKWKRRERIGFKC